MEILANWCVYMHEHRESGKKYIGITGQKPTRRWANGYGYRQNTRFFADIQEYGWDAFHHELLYTDLIQEEAERLEAEMIAKYGTQDPEKGYNLENGGRDQSHPSPETIQKMSDAKKGARNPWYGAPLPEEHRRKISESLTGKPGHPCSEENKKKIGERSKGNTYRAGKPHPAETRAAMSQARRGAANVRAHAVMCVETGARYDTITEAAARTGINGSHISAVCRGSRPKAGGYHWEYTEEAGGQE